MDRGAWRATVPEVASHRIFVFKSLCQAEEEKSKPRVCARMGSKGLGRWRAEVCRQVTQGRPDLLGLSIFLPPTPTSFTQTQGSQGRIRCPGGLTWSPWQRGPGGGWD